MAPIPPDPHADHAPAVDDMPLDTTAAPDTPAAVDPVPHGMAAHVLEREVGPLMARFPGVADEATVAALLATGNFWPADESDAELALALVKEAEKTARAEDGDDEDDEEEPQDGLPVEANTPPKRRGGRPRKAE